MNDSAIDAAAGGDLPFRAIASLVGEHARAAPEHLALVDAAGAIDYRTLDALMDRIAATLQRDGAAPGQAIAICAGMPGRTRISGTRCVGIDVSGKRC